MRLQSLLGNDMRLIVTYSLEGTKHWIYQTHSSETQIFKTLCKIWHRKYTNCVCYKHEYFYIYKKNKLKKKFNSGGTSLN